MASESAGVVTFELATIQMTKTITILVSRYEVHCTCTCIRIIGCDWLIHCRSKALPPWVAHDVDKACLQNLPDRRASCIISESTSNRQLCLKSCTNGRTQRHLKASRTAESLALHAKIPHRPSPGLAQFQRWYVSDISSKYYELVNVLLIIE